MHSLCAAGHSRTGINRIDFRGQGMLAALSAGFVVGVASQVVWPALPSVPLAVTALLVAIAALPGAKKGARIVACLAAGAAAGIGWASWQAGAVLDARLPQAREGEVMVVEGVVRSIQVHADGAMSFVLDVAELPWRASAGQLPGTRWRLRLGSWQPIAVASGESWRFTVKLKRPHASINPGVADFGRYLLGERVVASGYLREDAGNIRLSAASGWMAWRALLLASALPLLGAGAGDIAEDEATRFARAVLPALVVDERSLLTGAQWRVLANTGTAHLVAISGLHVALLWGAVLWFGGFLLHRRTGTLRYRVAAVLPALLVAAGYAALAGMPLPAARATIMLAVASLFLVANGAVPAWRVLLAATVAVLLPDPLAVHATGFWLSYGAVAVLLLLNDIRRRPPQVAGGGATILASAMAGVRMQTLLSVLLAPLLIALFGAASSSSVIANLPAIPLVNLLALPPGLAGFVLSPIWPAGANFCIDLAATALSVLWQMLAWIDAAAWLAPVRAHGVTDTGVVAMLLALGLLICARPAALRWVAVLLLVLAWPVAVRVPPGVADLCVLDVGQGLAVTMRTAQHALLYDAGPAWGADGDAGTAIVLPAARALGIDRLDTLVLSHDDLDHVGGAASIIAALTPREVIVGDPRTRGRGIVEGLASRCEVARRWQIDGIDLLLLPGAQRGADNDRSCVLRIAAGSHAVLLPGDITRRRELSLVEEWGDLLAADVLVAAHHGSRSSTAPTFLYRVAPAHVVFSTGYRNRFGHPHPQVVASIRRQGAAMHNTATDGALCLRLSPAALPVPVAARASSRRFWQP